MRFKAITHSNTAESLKMSHRAIIEQNNRSRGLV